MALDLTLLIRQLQDAPKASPLWDHLDTKSQQYLFKSFLNPLIQEKDVFLRDIDFSAFDLEDVGLLEDSYINHYEHISENERLLSFINRIKPCVTHKKSFF